MCYQTSYALWSRIRIDQRSRGTVKEAALEFGVLVVPLLLATTVFSSHPLVFNAILALPLLVLKADAHEAPIKPLARPKSIAVSPKDAPDSLWSKQVFNKPFVTVYRAHMMLMTVICILAVDFRIFPREFQKAETWGTSLVRLFLTSGRSSSTDWSAQMDLGVGSFVFSLGLISALPLLRRTDTRKFWPAVWQAVKRSAGVLALGFIRILSVKGVDYPVSVCIRNSS